MMKRNTIPSMTNALKTVFVFNTGSSSVKVSLLSPPASRIDKAKRNDTEEESSQASVPPLRILTAHAQRLGTDKSTIFISISSRLMSSLNTKQVENKTRESVMEEARIMTT
eukprot:898842_1